MSVAGWYKTYTPPFHALISSDIPFVLFRLDFENDMSHCIPSQEHPFVLLLRNTPIYCFAASDMWLHQLVGSQHCLYTLAAFTTLLLMLSTFCNVSGKSSRVVNDNMRQYKFVKHQRCHTVGITATVGKSIIQINSEYFSDFCITVLRTMICEVYHLQD